MVDHLSVSVRLYYGFMKINKIYLILTFISLYICLIPVIGECLDILSLEPGISREAVEDMLREESIRSTGYGKNALLLTMPVVPNIIERQRSLLEFDSKGLLSLVDIQIIPEPESSGPHVISLYDTVRDWMISRLGPPAWQRIEGRAVPEKLLEAISRGKVYRHLQWENSYAIRLGIPRRASGDVLIEIMIAPRMLPKGSKFWGRKRF